MLRAKHRHWTPADLFRNNERGFWLDIGDLDTISNNWSDPAGKAIVPGTDNAQIIHQKIARVNSTSNDYFYGENDTRSPILSLDALGKPFIDFNYDADTTDNMFHLANGIGVLGGTLSIMFGGYQDGTGNTNNGVITLNHGGASGQTLAVTEQSGGFFMSNLLDRSTKASFPIDSSTYQDVYGAHVRGPTLAEMYFSKGEYVEQGTPAVGVAGDTFGFVDVGNIAFNRFSNTRGYMRFWDIIVRSPAMSEMEIALYSRYVRAKMGLSV